MVDFITPYGVSVPAVRRCEVLLGGEIMEAAKEIKYLGIVLCKHGEMEGKKHEREL